MNRLTSPGLKKASFEQKWRVFKAEQLGLGHWCTRAAIWGELREAREEKDSGPMGEVRPMELLDLYARVEKAKTVSERYAILAEPIPERAQRVPGRPLVWFDIVRGLTARHIVNSVGRAAYELADNGNHRWEKALDLGTGTGNLGAVLLGHSDAPRSVESLTAIDMEQPLLTVADKRYPETQHVQGDATRLPFRDASFDLVVSGGLVYALEPDAQAGLFGEVSRVLKPGGGYLDGTYNPYLHPDAACTALESFIVSQVSPREILPPKYLDPFGPEDFAQLGLEYSSREYRGTKPHEVTKVRVLQKPPAS